VVEEEEVEEEEVEEEEVEEEEVEEEEVEEEEVEEEEVEEEEVEEEEVEKEEVAEDDDEMETDAMGKLAEEQEADKAYEKADKADDEGDGEEIGEVEKGRVEEGRGGEQDTDGDDDVIMEETSHTEEQRECASENTPLVDPGPLPSVGTKRPRADGNDAAPKTARVEEGQASVGTLPLPTEEEEDIFSDPAVMSDIASIEVAVSEERNDRLVTEAVQCKAGQSESALVKIHLLMEVLQKTSHQNGVSIAALGDKLEKVSTVLSTAVADTRSMHAEILSHLRSQSGTVPSSGRPLTQEDVDHHLSTLTKGTDDAIRGALDRHLSDFSRKQDEYRASVMEHVTQTVDTYRTHADAKLEDLQAADKASTEGAGIMRLHIYEKNRAALEQLEAVNGIVSHTALLVKEHEEAAIARHSERWKHTVAALNVHTDELREEVASAKTVLSEEVSSARKDVSTMGNYVTQLSLDVNALAGQMGDAMGAAINAP